MKKCILVLLALFIFKGAFCQHNYYKLVAGGNIGANATFADLSKKKPAQTFTASLDYNLTPFTSIGLELQNGTLTGGDRVNDPNKRFFRNDYTALSVGAKVQLGQIVDFEHNTILYAIRGLYSGIGVGVIRNSMSDGQIVRVQPGTNYVFPGTNKSTDLTVPLNTGINFNINDRWGYTRCIFNLNYQLNITSGEGIDGYDDASKGGAFSRIPDMYGVASVGFKVCFGPLGLY